ncbi:MAG TPA: FHA domain-containing protein [Acidimicrobiia bacterium]|nr:FHA domain-containing protein [Acidimicrobiia bacterium]
MSDSILTVLKFCLLALLYLFLLRVVLIVARELRGSAAPAAPAAVPPPAPAAAVRGSKRREWRLVVIVPETERGRSYPIDGDATIGRGGGCAVPLTFDTFVSQVHARAFDRDGTLWVEDAGSTNGTLVNSKRITQPMKLRKGDRIQVGETVLEAQR